MKLIWVNFQACIHKYNFPYKVKEFKLTIPIEWHLGTATDGYTP